MKKMLTESKLHYSRGYNMQFFVQKMLNYIYLKIHRLALNVKLLILFAPWKGPVWLEKRDKDLIVSFYCLYFWFFDIWSLADWRDCPFQGLVNSRDSERLPSEQSFHVQTNHSRAWFNYLLYQTFRLGTISLLWEQSTGQPRTNPCPRAPDIQCSHRKSVSPVSSNLPVEKMGRVHLLPSLLLPPCQFWVLGTTL